MSENNLEDQIKTEREKVRLNSIKMLKLLGYKQDPSNLSQEAIDARIELFMENKQNETKDPKTVTPTFFNPIDEERENKEAIEKSNQRVQELDELTSGYDALTAQIPQLRSNEQCGHYEGLASRSNIRILRLPASIKIDNNHSIIRRVVL